MRRAFFPSRLFEFVLGIVLAIALLEQNSGSNKLLNWSQNLLFKRRWFDIAGNWIIKQGLKNPPFSSPK
ncbi:MAG: hypothetical protein ACRC78_14600 [Planktothrix sp.]